MISQDKEELIKEIKKFQIRTKEVQDDLFLAQDYFNFDVCSIEQLQDWHIDLGVDLYYLEEELRQLEEVNKL